MFGQHMRVFGFARQILADARNKPVLLAPLAMNIALAVPVNAVLIGLSLFVPDSLAMALMPVGLSALYFIDYFCGGLNTAMVHEQQTTGNATLGSALKRTLRAGIGILVFAVVSGLLDFAVQVLSQRRLHLLRPLLLMVRSFWSTATFVIMPTMVIEGLGFGDAFKRSKELAANDPTQIGVGYIGIGLATSLISLLGFLLVSFVGGRILFPISPLLGLAFSLVVINATWAIAAYLKSTYYTCFYMWTRECERNRGVSPAFAPAPLRNVLADVDFRSMGIQLAPAAAAAAVAVAVAGAPGAGGFAAPPVSGFGAPPPVVGFAAPPQPGGFTAPQPQAFAPAPQPYAPAPQAFAPAPQPYAPAPQAFAPAPQAHAPAPQPYAPAPQPRPYASAPAPAPQPYASAPAPGPLPPPHPQASAPAPRPFPQPQPYASGPAPGPLPPPQPQASAPAPRPFPQPQPYASAPAPRPLPQSQPLPFAPASTPSFDATAHPSLDSGELESEATQVQPSPFDDDDATRVG